MLIKVAYCIGDKIYLLHVIYTSRPFGSGLFGSSSEPSSPLNSTEYSEGLEREHARNWITERFVTAVDEAKVICSLNDNAPSESIARKSSEQPQSCIARRGGL